jgi:hypothetical protein
MRSHEVAAEQVTGDVLDVSYEEPGRHGPGQLVMAQCFHGRS